MSLINKLTDKLKNVSKDTKKRILSLMLAGSIALTSGLGLTGCSLTNNPNTNDPNTNDPNSSISGDNGDNGNSYSKEDLYAQCSESLRTVLTDDYYRGLVLMAEYCDNFYQHKKQNDQEYMAIPYAFLEQEGYNIEAIKNGSIECSSQLYTDKNDLHIELRVLKEGNSDTEGRLKYYTCYDIKYTLTDQELNELNALFTKVRASNNAWKQPATYYQAPLFVQELSYHKTPEVLSVANIEYDTLITAELRFDADDVTTDYYHTVTYKEAIDTGTFTHITYYTFLSHFDMAAANDVKRNEKISIITYEDYSYLYTVGSDLVLYSPNSFDHFYFAPQFQEAYNNSFVDVTLYNCQNLNFVQLDQKVLEDLYGQSLNK